MTPHIHIGLVEFLTVAAYTLIFSFLWRFLLAKTSETTFGRGAAAVYS